MPGSTIAIALEGAELRVNVGEHAWEKHPQHPTRLRVNLTLVFDYRAYHERHGGYVDYDPLRSFLKALENKPHVNKLETLARQILDAAFTTTPADRVQLSLSKPDIFPEMDGVGLRIDVAREDLA
jgi:dihydroneopterin aldolase